jgi:hypothetical protein
MFLKDFTRTASADSLQPVIPATLACGLTADTLIETRAGWQPAARLAIGSRVQSLDGGAALVLGVTQCEVRNLPGILIPGPLADNCADLLLPAQQGLLLDTLQDPALPDADFVLVPALAFLALQGCRQQPINGRLIQPRFAQEEMLWANSGALLSCPALTPCTAFFDTLPLAAAQDFLRRRAAQLGLAVTPPRMPK